MASIGQWGELIIAFFSNYSPDEKSLPVLLDTAMGSENSGDHVIMDACNTIAEELLGKELEHVATHYYSSALDELDPEQEKILCGTNILYTDMVSQTQWTLPKTFPG